MERADDHDDHDDDDDDDETGEQSPEETRGLLVWGGKKAAPTPRPRPGPTTRDDDAVDDNTTT